MRRSIYTFLMCLVCLSCLITPINAQNLSDEEIEKIGNEAIKYYEEGNLDQAIQKFNEVLLANPSDEQALKLRELAGTERMMQMLVEGGEVARVARAILLYAEKTPVRQETSEENIQKYVEQAASGNIYSRNEAISLLSSQVGERAIPYMLPYLANQAKYEERINIILAVTRMGRSAVPPLVEALNSSNSFLRQQVAILLGHLKDKRALPDLKRIMENPQEDEEVKRYVEIAIRKIAKRPSIALVAAKHLYYQKALNYYRERPGYRPTHTNDWLYWRWEQEQLVSQKVPEFSYNEIMAEHACYHALNLDATYKRVWALLVQVYYAEYTETQNVADAAADRGLELPQDEEQYFSAEKSKVSLARSVSAAAGADILNLALHLSLKEKRPEVTVKILEALGKQYDRRRQLSIPMTKALAHSDKRIRYAAAESIVRINPPSRFRQVDQVVNVLAEALGEWDARVALVVAQDDATRNSLVKTIRDMKMVAFSSDNALKGLQRAKAFPPEDVIIISSQMKDLATAYVVNSLREDYRTKDIPVLILAPAEDQQKIQDTYAKVDQIKGVIALPLQEAIVASKIKEALADTGNDYKSKSRAVATRAASALASVPVNGGVFNLALAEEALIGTLRDRHDSIRNPALVALGKLGSDKAAPTILKILTDATVDMDIRTNAAWSLGQIYNSSKTKVSSEDVTEMLKVLQEKPGDTAEAKEKMANLQNMVFALLGQANIFLEDRRRVFLAHRVHNEIGTAKKVEEEEEYDGTEEETPEEETTEKENKEVGWGEEEEFGEEGYEEESSDSEDFEEGEEMEDFGDESEEDEGFEDDEGDSEEDDEGFEDEELEDDEGEDDWEE